MTIKINCAWCGDVIDPKLDSYHYTNDNEYVCMTCVNKKEELIEEINEAMKGMNIEELFEFSKQI